jgi:phage-related minor tail protein
MASNRIKGITIEIGGNTTQLTKSLEAVDKQLKGTQDQLKDVNKLLKLDPGNTDLLKQKQKLLGDAVGDTKKRLEELQKAYDQTKKSGDTKENQQQQDALQREIIETTEKLKDLEGQYKQCNPTLEAISSKTGALAEKTKGLSTAAGIAAGGMVAMAVSAGKSADQLLTDSKVTGFTVEELQKLQYAADRVDVSYDTMTGSIQKLTKQMASGNAAFDTLGVSITNEDGTMRSAVDVWYEAIAALGQVQNETERDQLSMELFGKSAMEMAGIVDDGGASLKALGDEAEQTGIILGQDAVEDAGKFNDALDKVKATAQQSFAKAGAALAESLLPMLEKLIKVVSDVLSWFANLDGTTQTVILVVLGLVAALSPLLSLISTITTALPLLSSAFAFLTGPVGIVIAAVAALIAIGVALYKNWDVIKEKAQQLWSNIKATFEKIKEAIMKPIEAAKEFVKNTIEKIKKFFDFKIELPKIKLPHFSIQPSGWKLGDLLKGSIPHLGIDWYAKAMDNGMIMNGPTIFGEQNGRLLGGGEAGSEVIVGLNSLMGMIQKAVNSQSAARGIEVNVTINGNVDDYNALAETIGQKLQQQLAHDGRALA